MSTKEKTADMGIDSSVEAVERYLKREFENFSISHVENRPSTHSFTVTDGKKLFKLCIPSSLLAEQDCSQWVSERLVHEHVAAEMRLHGEAGYHWPSECDRPLTQ